VSVPDTRLDELKEYVHAAEAARELRHAAPFEVEEVRDSGAARDAYAVRGLASVYNKWSLDLGGFRERVKPGAFDDVLSRDPHVVHVWDHDTSRTLSSTRARTYRLELNSVASGLKFYSRVAPTSYSADLRVLLEDGVIDQSSFAFTVEEDEWRISKDDVVERDIVRVGDLFDVTTCAFGAYPATESLLAMRSILARRTVSVAIPYAVSNTSGSTTNVTWTLEERAVAEEGGEKDVAAPEPDEAAPADDSTSQDDLGEQTAPQSPEAEERTAVDEEAWAKRIAEIDAVQRAVRDRAYGPKEG